MNEEKFIIRAYRKNELAMAFFPNCDKATAMNGLRSWFRANPRLKHLINRRIHVFTPTQVKQICIEVGKPYEYE